MKILIQEVQCPTCGAEEMHSSNEGIQIRGFKVCDKEGNWWSQCLVCAGYYDEPNGTYDESTGDRERGWFHD